MSLPDDRIRIAASNAHFLLSVRKGAHLGCDEKGRLYEDKTSSKTPSLFTHFTEYFWSDDAKKVEEETRKSRAIFEATKSLLETIKVQKPEIFHEKYREVMTVIEEDHALLSEDKKKIVRTYYHERFKNLLLSQVEDLTAEAIVTIEMSLDPDVDAEMREIISPEETSWGAAGSYFIKDRKGDRIGIFKPRDEELYMPNNPREIESDQIVGKRPGPREGHIPGISYLKESLAFSLAQDFAPVPYTTVITVPFRKTPDSETVITKQGSFQHFAPGASGLELAGKDFQRIPLEEAQKLAAFDLVIGNADRHLGNFLYDVPTKQLSLIDHGLILLDSLSWHKKGTPRSELVGHWMNWKQIEKPIDDKVKEWILQLDEHDWEKIIREQLQDRSVVDQDYVEGVVNETRTRILFVKTAVQMGFTLHEIGEMCMQNWNTKTCLLDTICQQMVQEVHERENPSEPLPFDPWKRLEEIIVEKLEGKNAEKSIKGMR